MPSWISITTEDQQPIGRTVIPESATPGQVGAHFYRDLWLHSLGPALSPGSAGLRSPFAMWRNVVQSLPEMHHGFSAPYAEPWSQILRSDGHG
jgi:hypothetical protein